MTASLHFVTKSQIMMTTSSQISKRICRLKYLSASFSQLSSSSSLSQPQLSFYSTDAAANNTSTSTTSIYTSLYGPNPHQNRPTAPSQINYQAHNVIGTRSFQINYSWDPRGEETLGRSRRRGLVDSGNRRQLKRSARAISPWHHIPYKFSLGPSSDAQEAATTPKTSQLYSFVNEIPNGTFRKIECDTKSYMNPLKQDIKKGQLRELKYSRFGIPFNYGMIPQTWEHPLKQSPALLRDDAEFAKCLGDKDPIDVCEISVTEASKMMNQGEVGRVKILGCLALIDEEEIDWKMIAVDEKFSDQYRDLKDVDPKMLHVIQDWFQNYKTVDSKPKNQFALKGEYQNAEYAIDVIEETHREWCELLRQHWDEGFNEWGLWIPDRVDDEV